MRTSLSSFVFIVALSFTFSAASCSSGPRRHPGIKNSPYTVRGIQYFPYSVQQARTYDEVGTASWYGPEHFFSGKGVTANGERVSSRSLSAAHKLLPLPSIVEVTNLENGRRAKLRVNDRGPFVGNRLLDVSPRAAETLGFKQNGLTNVRVRVLRVGD